TVLQLAEFAQATFQVTGTFSATITWEGTVDGSNWAAVALAQLGDTSRTRTLTSTTTGLLLLEEAGGLRGVRARVSAYTSGTVTVTGVASS
ncbi:MAG: hypothetical protein ACE5HE_15255, partial [Phycisphaerae bacterium]